MENSQDEIRLNKYLSDHGFCSRREADRLITEQKVTIDGKIAQMGQKVKPGQEVHVNKKKIADKDEAVLLLLNKPRGIVCTAEKREKNNIIKFVNYPSRIYPIGRLDKDSEGLILLTNQGEIVNKIMKARNFHEKEYIVTVNREITGAFLKKMSEGVPILDTITRTCKVEKIGKFTFRIILTQGLNRQIRRMCEYLGYEVTKLKRIRIMNLKLGEIPSGKYRKITPQEYQELLLLLKKGE